MFELVKKLFGIKPAINLAELVQQGAIILDVRTKAEFEGGHIRGSVNIPLDKLHANMTKLKSKNKTIITCCASGSRSATAKSVLIHNGFSNVHNGGSWFRLRSKINA